ncbi:MAG: fructose 1,6-bisphosphatase [Candidatus Angelobacter sp.]
MEMRRQGFSVAAMLPMAELEYTGVMEMLDRMDKRFTVRTKKAPLAA